MSFYHCARLNLFDVQNTMIISDWKLSCIQFAWFCICASCNRWNYEVKRWKAERERESGRKRADWGKTSILIFHFQVIHDPVYHTHDKVYHTLHTSQKYLSTAKLSKATTGSFCLESSTKFIIKALIWWLDVRLQILKMLNANVNTN